MFKGVNIHNDRNEKKINKIEQKVDTILRQLTHNSVELFGKN